MAGGLKAGVLDLLEELERKGGCRRFRLRPETVWAAMVASIKLSLQLGFESVPESMWPILGQAQALGAEAFDLVMVAYDDCSPKLRGTRAKALEICRLWLLERMGQALERAPYTLEIERDKRFRA